MRSWSLRLSRCFPSSGFFARFSACLDLVDRDQFEAELLRGYNGSYFVPPSQRVADCDASASSHEGCETLECCIYVEEVSVLSRYVLRTHLVLHTHSRATCSIHVYVSFSILTFSNSPRYNMTSLYSAF
ncbi:hypothetical protein K503DRAFT_625972 [Rhizopogon vinicolor AM-OR11-026]|uniref:Uncharacterized protein n=1 Tax=Rhizopogon vinicolor AM-OR11-026 TaxID=1314800 RepID=A0A1B7MI28_9AGAM|nr:hypothetical protein K503DRAFT_625972 [Rhizopogon vinicolor AM-OR11-026]